MVKKSSNLNNTFLIIVLLCLIYIVVALVFGSSERKLFEGNLKSFDNAYTDLSQGRYQEAETIFNNLLQQQPDNYLLLWNNGLAYLGQGNNKSALDYFTKARQQRPVLVNNQRFLASYGQALFNLGDFSEAKKYWSRAVALNQEAQITFELQNKIKQLEEEPGGKKNG